MIFSKWPEEMTVRIDILCKLKFLSQTYWLTFTWKVQFALVMYVHGYAITRNLYEFPFFYSFLVF